MINMETFYKKLVYVTLFCAVFCFDWSIQDKLRVTAQSPIVLMLRQQAEKCGAETGVPAAHLKKIFDKTLPTDAANNQFFFCVLSGGGFADQDGHLSMEKMTSLDVLDGTAEDYANTLKECNKISNANSLETLLAVADCVHANYQFAPAAQQ